MAPTPVKSGTGFVRMGSGVPKIRRMIISIEALEKRGKNHFAFSAPGLKKFHSFDYGDEGVVEKFVRKGSPLYSGDIDKAEYILRVPDGANVQETSNAASPVWGAFKANYLLGLSTGRVTIVDTATDAYEIIRLSYFGKLLQVMPHHYAPVNAEFKTLYRDAYSSTSSLIMLHRLTEEWINKVDKTGKEVGTKTGKYVMKGYGNTYFETQINLRCDKDDDGFFTTVLACRQNPDIEGLELRGEMNNFVALGQMVYPDSTPEEWGA